MHWDTDLRKFALIFHYSIMNCFLKQFFSINIYEIWNDDA